MNVIQNLSQNIAANRKRIGLTQEALAAKLGLTFQAVSKWETGAAAPDISVLPMLADIFGICLDALFGRTNTAADEPCPNPPWPDDETLRAAVFRGHRLLERTEDLSPFKFKLEGKPLNVISYCSIECGTIQNGASADGNINCGAGISGGAHADGNINCGAGISGGAHADGNINCDAGISGGAQADGNIGCGEIAGAVHCGGDLTCRVIGGDASCDGNIIYVKD